MATTTHPLPAVHTYETDEEMVIEVEVPAGGRNVKIQIEGPTARWHGAGAPGGGRMCVLEAAAGVVEPCDGPGCPFWEPGGAVLQETCAVERLGILAIPAAVECFRETRRELDLDASSSARRHAFGRFLPVDLEEVQ